MENNGYCPPDPKGFQSIAESLKEAREVFLRSQGGSVEPQTNRLIFADEKHATEFDKKYREYVESLGEQAEPESSEGDNVESFARFGDWTLVGKGPITNDDCASFLGLSSCKEALENPHHHDFSTLDGGDFTGKTEVKKVFKSCDKSTCPVCYRRGWTYHEAGNIADTIGEASKKFGLAEHVIIGVPLCDYGLSFEALKLKARKVAFLRGVVGGCMIWHPFRYRKYDVVRGGIRCMRGWFYAPHWHLISFFNNSYHVKCRLCPKMKPYHIKTKSGRVVERIGNAETCSGCDGFEARFRLLGFGELQGKDAKGKYVFSGFWSDKAGKRHKADGYIVKVAELRSSIFYTACYQLNHSGNKVGAGSGVGTRFSPITWFGVCGCRKMKLVKGHRHKSRCGICGGEMVPVRYLGRELYKMFDWLAFDNFVVPMQEVVDGFLMPVFEVDKVALAKRDRLKRLSGA